jgi:hypothetical protein
MGTEPQLKVALKDVPESQLPDGIKGGDTKLIWSADNEAEIDNAKRTFDDLRKKGFAAFKVNRLGNKGEQIFSFDAEAEKLILTPALRGG